MCEILLLRWTTGPRRSAVTESNGPSEKTSLCGRRREKARLIQAALSALHQCSLRSQNLGSRRQSYLQRLLSSRFPVEGLSE